MTAILLSVAAAGHDRDSVITVDRPSLRARIEGRGYPSVFQAWSPADNRPDEEEEATLARHDLFFGVPEQMGLRWSGRHPGLAIQFDAESVKAGRARRDRLLARNRHMVFLAEIRYRDAHRSHLPDGHPWWKTGPDGRPAAGWEEGGYFLLDFASGEVQDQVARQAKAVVESGVFDGVMLDWWVDDGDRLRLARRVREAIGPKSLQLVNANDRTTPRTAPYVNGYFMECYRSETPEDWRRIEETLRWAERNLRRPRVNCLETWWAGSRADASRMRATTTLSLVASDGYCLFSDPNPLPSPDHLHDWQPFWDKRLGMPLKAGRKRADGAMERDYDLGTAVYNPIGNAAVTVSFSTPRRSAATGREAREFLLPAFDGDLYLRKLSERNGSGSP